jgi:hypothetical protein
LAAYENISHEEVAEFEEDLHAMETLCLSEGVGLLILENKVTYKIEEDLKTFAISHKQTVTNLLHNGAII